MTNPYEITPLTLLDYPGSIAASIHWFAGCNLRFPYCYNPNIVFGKPGDKDVMDFISERAGFIQAVVMSGGECTLNPDLKELCKRIKNEYGLLIKIDTNGSQPKVVRELLDDRLIDYAALDHKWPAHKDVTLPNGKSLFDQFKATLHILNYYRIPYEVRTAVHPDLLSEDDIITMINEAYDAGYRGKYWLQMFFNTGNTIGNIAPPSRAYDTSKIESASPLEIGYRNF